MSKVQLKQNIQLLQGFYRFLYLGNFLNQTIQHHDFSHLAVDFPLSTGKNTKFIIKGATVKKILSEIYSHPDKKNVFGYLVEISALRGVFSIMREMIDTESEFNDFLKRRLKTHYFVFGQTIRLIRNVLNHIETAGMKLNIAHFIKQKVYLLKEKEISLLVCKIKYADYFPEWKGSPDYGLNITVDFSKLREGQKIFDIIPLHQMYLLAEFCFNLSKIFGSKIKSKV